MFEIRQNPQVAMMDRDDGQALGHLCRTTFHEGFNLQQFGVIDRHYQHKQLEWACRDTFQEDFQIPPFDLELLHAGCKPDMDASRTFAVHDEGNTVQIRKQTTLLTIPIELRFIIYEYIVPTVRVSPTVTTTQLALLQTYHLMRHEAKTIYFAHLDQIDQEARKLREQKMVRFAKEENGHDFSVVGHMVQSLVQRDDVLALTREMRWVSFGAVQKNEADEAETSEEEDGVECGELGSAAQKAVFTWTFGSTVGRLALFTLLVLGFW